MKTTRTDIAGSLSRVGYVRLRDAIRSDIITGVFDSGVRLKIPDLCRRYDVSSIPVREALQQLQGEGLIVMMPNRGATVRSVDSAFVSEIYEVREAIDAAMARRFVEFATADALASLERAQDEMERCENAGDTLGRHQADREFHRIILVGANNREAMLIIERQNNIINTLRLGYGQSEARRLQVRREHRALIEAIRKGDAKRAGTIAGSHARNARNDLIAVMRDRGSTS
ncbi:MAG: GntR family transcriptional regulator [Pseudomonadota bacterium]|nr:GntR family transcriptional regulator [Pseudomonadota bacterium]